MITIYSKPGCEFCIQAKTIMTNKQIQFEERMLGQDFMREDILKMFPHMKTFPIIVHNDKVIGGFSEFITELHNGNTFGKILLNE